MKKMTELVSYLNLDLLVGSILVAIVIGLLMMKERQQKEEIYKQQSKMKFELYDEMARQYRELDERIKTLEIEKRAYEKDNADKATTIKTYYGGSNPLD